MKKLLFGVIVSLFLGGCESENLKNIELDGQTFRVEVATTPEQQRTGLMNRTHLKLHEGMLFEFSEEKPHSFWMKNTPLPLLGIWISDDKRIVDIQKMSPCLSNPCPIYTPKAKAKWVLEIKDREGFWPEEIAF